MATDFDKEFKRYTERFERLVGALQPGQYGNYKGRLVRRFDAEQFSEKVNEYMALGQKFTESLSAGDTIDDAVTVDLRATEIELVLEKSLFLPS